MFPSGVGSCPSNRCHIVFSFGDLFFQWEQNDYRRTIKMVLGLLNEIETRMKKKEDWAFLQLIKSSRALLELIKSYWASTEL